MAVDNVTAKRIKDAYFDIGFAYQLQGCRATMTVPSRGALHSVMLVGRTSQAGTMLDHRRGTA
jgi:hypothetical protein